MRHVCGLQEWESWNEGGGLAGTEEDDRLKIQWAKWVEDVREQEEELEQEEDGGED